MFFNTDTVNKIYEQTCLEAYAKGYKDALLRTLDNWQPGVYNSKLYIQHYREGFMKGMTDTTDIKKQIEEIEAA